MTQGPPTESLQREITVSNPYNPYLFHPHAVSPGRSTATSKATTPSRGASYPQAKRTDAGAPELSRKRKVSARSSSYKTDSLRQNTDDAAAAAAVASAETGTAMSTAHARNATPVKRKEVASSPSVLPMATTPSSVATAPSSTTQVAATPPGLGTPQVGVTPYPTTTTTCPFTPGPISLTPATATTPETITVPPKQIVTLLRQSGFRNEDEIQNAIRIVQRTQQEQLEKQQRGDHDGIDDDTPILMTVESVMCALIQAREDAQLAKDMDEARRLSEMEYEQETRRLRQTEQLEQEEDILLCFTREDLLRPAKDTSSSRGSFISGFGASWLLNDANLHATVQTILKTTNPTNDQDDDHKDDRNSSSCTADENANNDINMQSKKLLLRLLKLEKNARKWYSNGIPQWYFTQELTERLVPLLSSRQVPVDAHDDMLPASAGLPQQQTLGQGDEVTIMSRIEEELEKICTEVEEGHALLAKQDRNQIPWIYVHAKEKYGKTQHSSLSPSRPTKANKGATKNDDNYDNGDDDDDDVIVLDDEQVQQLIRPSDTSTTAIAQEIMVDP